MGKRTRTTIRDSQQAKALRARVRHPGGRHRAVDTTPPPAVAVPSSPAVAPAVADAPGQRFEPPPVPDAGPAAVAAAATAAGLRRAAAAIPASARVQIERLAPAWCRGYLETTDGDAISALGLREYLLSTWGGERYRVTVVDDRGRELWTAADLLIGGPPRHYGQELRPPPPVAAPAYPPAPGIAQGPDPNIKALADAMIEQSRAIAAALAAAAGRTAEPTAPPPPPSPSPSAAIIETLREAETIRRALANFAPEPPPPPSAEPPPAPTSPVTDAVLKTIGQRIAERVADQIAPAHAQGPRVVPFQPAAAEPEEPETHEAIPEAEKN